MLAYAKSLGIRSLNLNSNGMLLGPDLVQPILNSGVDLVVFGVDGISRETYENIRVGGKRDQVYANIERFLSQRLKMSSGPKVMVQFIEMDENSHEFGAFKDYWLDRGAIVKARRKLSWGGSINSPLEVPPDQRIPCPWAFNLMHVTWNGTVARCPGDIEGAEAVGSVWDEPLDLLWRHLGEYRKHHLNRRFEKLPRTCANCKDWMVGAAEKILPSWGPFGDSRHLDISSQNSRSL